jgi:hypothetical protein
VHSNSTPGVAFSKRRPLLLGCALADAGESKAVRHEAMGWERGPANRLAEQVQ